MHTCGYIVPRQSEIVGLREDNYIAGCILGEGHSGRHLIRTPEGQFFSWGFDEECTCEDCLDHTDSNNRCYLYRSISAKEALALLNRE